MSEHPHPRASIGAAVEHHAPAEAAPTERLLRAARAAHELGEVLWDALHDELQHLSAPAFSQGAVEALAGSSPPPRAQRVAELSQRLADVSSTIALLATGIPAAVAPPSPEAPASHSASAPRSEPVPRSESAPGLEHASGLEHAPRSAPAPRPATFHPSSAATIVDELAREEPAYASEEPAYAPGEPPYAPGEPAYAPGEPAYAPGEPPYAPGEPAYATSPSAAFASPFSAPPHTSPEIEIRDARGDDDGPAAWIGSIGRRLERYAGDRLPFAVLLIEVSGIERLAHAELPGELSSLIDRLESALGNELRPADQLTRESLGRYWLVTPETDSIGAHMLAERLARAARLSASHRAAPLEVVVGIAVCPEHGREASALAAHADIGLYAARAAGRTVAPIDQP
jgi:GGDEF domain-containing protein